MLDIYKPSYIKINSIEYLCFDIFIKNFQLYLICPYYKNNPIPFILKVNNKKIKITKKIVQILHEPFLIYIFTIPNEERNSDLFTISINYNKKIFTKNLKNSNYNEKKNKLSLTTLCKNDLYLLPLFLNYYVQQNVGAFYIYVNKKLTENILTYIKNIVNEISNIHIIIIEWNFPYYLYKEHHAQPSQIHHSLYFYGKPENEYMIFCDLDEYFYIKNEKILNLIENNPDIDTFGFHNIWSKTIDSKVPTTFPKKFLTTKKYLKYSERSKCIHKTKSIEKINIHYHNTFLISNPKILINNIFFHFYHFSQSKRIIPDKYYITELPIT